MQSSLRKILIGFSILATAAIVSISGYMLAGWSFLDSLYMVVITFYGVGYGETHPITDPRLRLFTIFVVISGCTSAVYVLGGFVQLIAEGEFNRYLGARRMTQGIERLENHVIICGFGRVGRVLIEELAAAGEKFVIIDPHQAELQEAENEGHLVLIGDATHENVLLTAGIKRARVLASVVSDDAANVFIVLTARELNPTIEIIARGESVSTKSKLLRSGANRVVLPAAIGATKIADLITHPTAESLLANDQVESRLNDELRQIGLAIKEIRVTFDSILAHKKLGAMVLTNSHLFIIVAVRRANGEILRSPDAEYKFEIGTPSFSSASASPLVFIDANLRPRNPTAAKYREITTLFVDGMPHLDSEMPLLSPPGRLLENVLGFRTVARPGPPGIEHEFRRF
ncbi:MAG: potassium channel family protein [Planctomycetales bacterium]